MSVVAKTLGYADKLTKCLLDPKKHATTAIRLSKISLAEQPQFRLFFFFFRL